MNVQTEHLENRTARLTVEIDPERLEVAKKRAARAIAKRVNIPGFRKGKAPYRILVQNGLEGQIIMDAVDDLGQQIYRESLEQSDLEPYGPGSFEDYQLEPSPTFIYTVPLQPEVELNDYRSVRVEYHKPEVADEQVDDAMERLQQQEALVETSSQPAAEGNRVTLDIHSEFADEAPEPAEGEEPGPEQGSAFVHEHDGQITLNSEDEPLLPGFTAQIIGANIDDELDFELEVPEDSEDYDDIAGRKVHFHIHVKNIETVTLPALNDEFAARLTEDDESEEEPLTLLELRMRIRENIENQLEQRVQQEYASNVLGEMAEIADIAYPEAMVQDQIDDMLADLDKRLQEQGLSMDMYMKVTGMTEDDLREQYREQAEDSIRRSLVLSEIVKQEELTVPESRIEERIDMSLKQFGGEQAEALRPMFDTPDMRSAIANDMLQSMVLDFVIAIGKGEDPEATLPQPEAEENEPDEAEAVEEAEVVEEAEAAEADAEPTQPEQDQEKTDE